MRNCLAWLVAFTGRSGVEGNQRVADSKDPCDASPHVINFRNHRAKYIVPRFCPFTLTFFAAMSFCIGRRIVPTSVPSAATICSPRWPGFA